ncbi:MAG: HD domain-containing protein [Dehalococcoidia bacterium]|nr:HD domain-containing protein [Dehalococcoidia bacterium]
MPPILPRKDAPDHQRPGPDPELRSLLSRVRRFFSDNGVSAYLVGGFVRDLLLGRPTHDVDIAVDGDALDLSRRLADGLGGAWVLMDAENNVGRVVLTLESGARFYLDISRLQGGPAASLAQALRADLARRDFTANALAAPLDALDGDISAALVDTCEGRADIEARVLRAVSDHTFSDDPVRLLRGVRFMAGLDFRMDPGTEALARRDAPLLARATPERARDEFLRTLALPFADRHLRLMDSLGILDVLLPELGAGRGCSQPKEHHWDVFNHSIEAVAAVESVLRQRSDAYAPAGRMPWAADIAAHFQEEVSDGHSRATLLKLAALLHDVAKPETRTVDTDGRIRFLGHHVLGAERVQRIAERMRMGSRGVRLLTLMVEHHLRPAAMSGDTDDMPTRRALYRYFRDAADAAMDTLYLNAADFLAARGPTLDTQSWESYCQRIAYALEWREQQKARTPPAAPRLVDGKALMEALGLPPGPVVGQLLDALREAEAVGEIADRYAALDLARRLLPQLQKSRRMP